VEVRKSFCCNNRESGNGRKTAMNENQVASQFKTGNPGGPGRPRRTPLSDAYREILASEFPKDLARKMGLRIGSTWLDAIATQAARTALKLTEGGTSARKEIREAIEGRAKQRIEFGEAGSSPCEFYIVYAPDKPNVKPLPESEPAIDVAPELPDSEPSES
jgi:hypothetical protein